MPHKINYSPDDSLIVVQRYGDVDIEDMRKSLKQVMELSANEDVNAALIDVREVSSFPSVDEIYNFSVNLPENIRFAIVLPVPDENRRQHFREIEKIFNVQESATVLGKISRGSNKLVNVFEDYEEAERWLLENA